MKRILFVDDDRNILSGLKRVLRPMRQQWETIFVDGGEKALTALHESPADIVVSDMRMPQMDGATLLTIIMEKWPDTVRIVLSGYSDSEMVLRAANVAHQFLPKPCEAKVLLSTLNRSCVLSDLLKSKRLKSLVAGMATLPSLPNLYLEITNLLQSEEPSLRKVGDIVGQDIAMTAKILQLVNSAFFGLPRHISTIADAVSLLGVDNIKALVLSFQIFSQFDIHLLKKLKLETIWPHSIRVGRLARAISLTAGAGKQNSDHAFLAGTVHDLGKIVTAVNQPDKYLHFLDRVKMASEDAIAIEREVFEASHSEIGAYLLGMWGLTDSIIEAVLYHHDPQAAGPAEFSPLVSVHVANALDNLSGKSKGGTGDTTLDHTLLNSFDGMDIANLLEQWLALAKELDESRQHEQEALGRNLT